MQAEVRRYNTHLQALRALGVEPDANGLSVTIDGRRVDVALIADVGLERALFGAPGGLSKNLATMFPDALWTTNFDGNKLIGRGVIKAGDVRIVVELPYMQRITRVAIARVSSTVQRLCRVVRAWYGLEQKKEEDDDTNRSDQGTA